MNNAGQSDSGSVVNNTSGGGGGSSSTSSNIESSVAYSWQELERGSQGSFVINDEKIAITEIDFGIENAVLNSLLTVDSLRFNPEPIAAAAKVYQYLQLKKEGLGDSDISDIHVQFKVPLFWLNNNNIAEDEISLYRYNNNQWNILPTTKKSADQSDVFYDSITPGFSTFAIGNKEAPTEKVDRKVIEIMEKGGILDFTGYPIAISLFKPDLIQYFDIKNVGDGDLTNLDLNLVGLPLDSYNIIPESPQTLASHQSTTFTIQFDNKFFEIGTYNIKLVVSSDQGAKEIDGVLVIEEKAKKTAGFLSSNTFFKMLYVAAALIVLALIVLVVIVLIRRVKKMKKKSQPSISKNGSWNDIDRMIKNLK